MVLFHHVRELDDEPWRATTVAESLQSKDGFATSNESKSRGWSDV